MTARNGRQPEVAGAEVSKIPVLYIGGTGRTGSTVLEQILGSLQGVASIGEMTWFWYAMRSGGRCSCGDRYSDCEFWGPALHSAYGAGGIDPSRMYRLRMRHDSRHLPLLSVPALRQPLLNRLGEFRDRLVPLYRSVLTESGSSIIVDSSKEPHYAYLLASHPEFDVRVCHLVRHPVGTAWSWSRKRVEHGFGGGHEMETRGPVSASVYYDVSNAWTERLFGSSPRYLRVRYEDFVAEPLSTLSAICEFGGIDTDVTSVLSRRERGWVASIGRVHSAWGNPNRFGGGELLLRPDDEWRSGAPEEFRRTVWRMTRRVARRYGYTEA